jgi:hypothetical protein
MKQFVITPAAGKQLIARALLVHPSLRQSLQSGTVVIIAGTTNGYFAEALLTDLKQNDGFSRNRFFRGITLPPHEKTTEAGRLPDESTFPGDVVIVNGFWKKGATINDVVGTLKQGDVIVKGANCLDLHHRRAGILIGHPQGGTIITALQAVVGRRVQLIIPMGLEKRISEDIDTVASLLNSPDASGPRLLPVPGEVISELEAIALLCGAQATLVAGGGVGGAEGAVRVAVDGTPEQLFTITQIINEIGSKPPFSL